jgi:hypothetical protein
MCCYAVELILVPFLTMPAAILSVISMSSKNWLEAYVEEEGRGKVLFAQLSPWYLCASECTDCSATRRQNMDCFWMRDWAATGFGRLAAVQHLEYWCLGALILSLFPSLVVCLDRRGRLCPLDCRRPAIILLGVAGLLSITALGVFGGGKYSSLEEFSNGHHLFNHLAWPFYVRVLASLLTVLATALSILHEFKSRRGGYEMTESDEEKVIVVPMYDDDVDEYPDYGDTL